MADVGVVAGFVLTAWLAMAVYLWRTRVFAENDTLIAINGLCTHRVKFLDLTRRSNVQGFITFETRQGKAVFVHAVGRSALSTLMRPHRMTRGDVFLAWVDDHCRRVEAAGEGEPDLAS